MGTRSRYISNFVVSSNDIANSTITFSDIGTVYTDNVTERSNLYFTNARVVSALTAGSGINIAANGMVTSTALGGVTSVGGATGAVSNIQLASGITSSGILTTSNVIEGTNLYYTNTRARYAISVTGSGSYDNTTGVITITGGVSSVGGASGAISNNQLALAISSSGLLTTSNVSEGTNLYYTNTRARYAITTTGNLLSYNNTTGVLSFTANNIASVNKFYYTATSSQTAFYGPDENSRTLNILSPNDVHVFLNGVLLIPTIDYSANSTQVTFTEGVTANSNVVIIDTFVSVGPIATANISKFTFNSTESQTIFSGADRDGKSLFLNVPSAAYVYLNGILLTQNNDYEAYTTNVTLTTGVEANSTVTIIDALLQASGYASEAFVTQQINNLIDAAPGALDTLNELAAALGDDANFSTTVLTSLSNKANVSQLTTANVTELTNLYYTNARVYSNVTTIGYSTAAKTYAFTRIF